MEVILMRLAVTCNATLAVVLILAYFNKKPRIRSEAVGTAILVGVLLLNSIALLRQS